MDMENKNNNSNTHDSHSNIGLNNLQFGWCQSAHLICSHDRLCCFYMHWTCKQLLHPFIVYFIHSMSHEPFYYFNGNHWWHKTPKIWVSNTGHFFQCNLSLKTLNCIDYYSHEQMHFRTWHSPHSMYWVLIHKHHGNDDLKINYSNIEILEKEYLNLTV